MSQPSRIRIHEDQLPALAAAGIQLRPATYLQVAGPCQPPAFLITGKGVATRLMVAYRHGQIALVRDIREALSAPPVNTITARA